MDNNLNFNDNNKSINFKEEFIRYLTFWPWFLVSLITTLISAFLYLRYAEYNYSAHAKIEILDKSQDSEMSLPTAMTVFNRSMINLENEIGVLSSYSLHDNVIKKLQSNIKYYTHGKIKTTENHPTEWLIDYEIKFNIDFDTIAKPIIYNIGIDDNKLTISHFDNKDEFVKSYKFTTLNTSDDNHGLPFNINLNANSLKAGEKKTIKIYPIETIVESFRNATKISKVGQDSDHLSISLVHPNILIAEEYLNSLLYEFDNDGISDRQLEYKRTMEFVDSRSDFLTKELGQIELKKQNFKEENKLTDIQSDASINVNQQFAYDSELFSVQSQKDLALILKETLSDEFKLIPVNIGLENSSINSLILEYNKLLKERERSLLSAGKNNTYVKNIEKQLVDFYKNINQSIDSYILSLDKTIVNLEQKEKEFADVYRNIPENEKILRSIERELSVKEALFLLLLQKREEASINYAVVKPSIKIIDRAMSDAKPVSPNNSFVYLAALVFGVAIPFSVIFSIFYLNSKIHTRKQLSLLLDDIPIIGEIPQILDSEKVNEIFTGVSRDPIAESIRMVIANLNFVLFNKVNSKANNILLVTSSVKGEGKTVISANLASLLSNKYERVLLIGADLRNPQIHKYLGLDKSVKGLTDCIYKKNNNWRDFIRKYNDLDILLSGTIPPNPNELLSSNKFEEILNEVKKEYDYIVIDSAPCLLVSDTFEISKYVDTTLYVVRANHSDIKLVEFINESKKQNKLSNVNIVLNGVGASSAYGYKYGYQYGYKYSYKYSYNYGYGYGYTEDKS